jgi:hypothetical protein
MLNIRINFTVNLKKVGAVLMVLAISSSHLVSPAYALQAVTVDPEKVVTVSLTHLKVQTTKTAARKSLASPESKYFDAEAVAFLTVYSKNWSMKDWKCLRNMWTKESHFNPKALNKSSGAFGIAQFMPTTWGNYKVVKTDSAALQVKYGLRYIKNRYGSTNDPAGACNAWKFWQKHNWY